MADTKPANVPDKEKPKRAPRVNIGRRLAMLFSDSRELSFERANAILGGVSRETFRIVQSLHKLYERADSGTRGHGFGKVHDGVWTPQEAVAKMAIPEELQTEVDEIVKEWGVDLVQRAIEQGESGP